MIVRFRSLVARLFGSGHRSAFIRDARKSSLLIIFLPRWEFFILAIDFLDDAFEPFSRFLTSSPFLMMPLAFITLVRAFSSSISLLRVYLGQLHGALSFATSRENFLTLPSLSFLIPAMNRFWYCLGADSDERLEWDVAAVLILAVYRY